MAELYGSHATPVYDFLEQLDPELNELIQRFAYDQLWLRPGLTIREKSITTVSAVVATGSERAMRLHMLGFLSSGGTVEELRAILVHLIGYVGFPPVLAAFTVLQQIRGEAEVNAEAAK